MCLGSAAKTLANGLGKLRLDHRNQVRNVPTTTGSLPIIKRFLCHDLAFRSLRNLSDLMPRSCRRFVPKGS